MAAPSRIPTLEYDSLAELMRAHLEVHGQNLQAMVAFGELVEKGFPYDLEVLEVVAHWNGPKFFEFSSTAQLPLRGLLHLYFLRPDEVEGSFDAGYEAWTLALLNRVMRSHDVVYERKAGLFEEMVRHLPKVAGEVLQPQKPSNPLKLPSNE